MEIRIIVKCEIITNPSFSDCLQGSSAALSALLQLPWELIFYSKTPLGRKTQLAVYALCRTACARQAFSNTTVFPLSGCFGRCSRPTFCMPDGGCIRAKTCMNSFYTFQKRKRGNASEEIRTKERACFCTPAENGPAVHSHPAASTGMVSGRWTANSAVAGASPTSTTLWRTRKIKRKCSSSIVRWKRHCRPTRSRKSPSSTNG